MTKRGYILKDTSAGPGVVSVDGNPYRFTIEHMWQSHVAPSVGMEVDVVFHPDVGIKSMHAVLAMETPHAPTSTAAAHLVSLAAPSVHPPAVSAWIKGRVDIPRMIAFAALLIGWFALPALTVGFAGMGVAITFWQLISHLGRWESLAIGAVHGVDNVPMTLLTLASLGAVAGTAIWRDRRLSLLACLPLMLMGIATISVLGGLHQATQTETTLFGTVIGDSLARGTEKMIQIAAGGYIALIAAVYLAFEGVRGVLRRR